MNTNFTGWPKDEEQIDPSFARHQDADFGSVTVDDVTAAAAIAHAQSNSNQSNSNTNLNTSHGNTGTDDKNNSRKASDVTDINQAIHDQENEVTSQLAAEIHRQQQQQQQNQQAQQEHQHQHHLSTNEAIARASVLGNEGQHESSNIKKANGTGGPIRHSSTSSSGLSSPISGNPRQLSGTKRAAQNRNAQKAFRQRKEKYIKDLEATAAETTSLKQTIEELRAENLQLRDYTLALQSRVIELSPGNHTSSANNNNNNNSENNNNTDSNSNSNANTGTHSNANNSIGNNNNNSSHNTSANTNNNSNDLAGVPTPPVVFNNKTFDK